MIAVCIATYNHEAFIAQAIESVLAQVCDEPLHIYIGDDASTDGTQTVCERFAKKDDRIVYVRRKKNVGLVANTIDLYRRIMVDGCEYIAMLDGDDYWTDPNKLQIQIDYLRNHPEVGFVHTGAFEERDGQRCLVSDSNIPTGDLSLKYNCQGARQTNCSVLFRAGLLNNVNLEETAKQNFPILDYPLYGLFAQYTQFAYLPSPTAVWRNHISVSQPQGLKASMHYRCERIRMWKWLNEQGDGHFHFRWYKAILWYIWQIFHILFA